MPCTALQWLVLCLPDCKLGLLHLAQSAGMIAAAVHAEQASLGCKLSGFVRYRCRCPGPQRFRGARSGAVGFARAEPVRFAAAEPSLGSVEVRPRTSQCVNTEQ